jgi:hypothetical protein
MYTGKIIVAMEYFFKCAVERGRSSSGTILHDEFKAIKCYLDYDSFYSHLKEIYPECTDKTKFVIIGN